MGLAASRVQAGVLAQTQTMYSKPPPVNARDKVNNRDKTVRATRVSKAPARGGKVRTVRAIKAPDSREISRLPTANVRVKGGKGEMVKAIKVPGSKTSRRRMRSKLPTRRVRKTRMKMAIADRMVSAARVEARAVVRDRARVRINNKSHPTHSQVINPDKTRAAHATATAPARARGTMPAAGAVP